MDIKSISYTAISQMKAVKEGWFSYQQAKETVDRWMEGTTKDEIIEYFKNRGYKERSGDIPEWVVDELSKDAWEAFEYFNII